MEFVVKVFFGNILALLYMCTSRFLPVLVSFNTDVCTVGVVPRILWQWTSCCRLPSLGSVPHSWSFSIIRLRPRSHLFLCKIMLTQSEATTSRCCVYILVLFVSDWTGYEIWPLAGTEQLSVTEADLLKKGVESSLLSFSCKNLTTTKESI